MAKKKKIIAKSPEDVKEWIETTPHHQADFDEVNLTLTLTGRATKIVIPQKIWQKCHVHSGDKFDNRMYRWGKQKS